MPEPILALAETLAIWQGCLIFASRPLAPIPASPLRITLQLHHQLTAVVLRDLHRREYVGREPGFEPAAVGARDVRRVVMARGHVDLLFALCGVVLRLDVVAHGDRQGEIVLAVEQTSLDRKHYRVSLDRAWLRSELMLSFVVHTDGVARPVETHVPLLVLDRGIHRVVVTQSLRQVAFPAERGS